MEELKFLRGTKASYDNLANVDANAVYITTSGETASEIHIDGVTWSSNDIIFGEIIKNEKVVVTSLQNIMDSVGLNESLKFEEFTDTNYLNGIKDIKECLVKLDGTLKKLTSTIETSKMYHKVTSSDALISLAPFSSFKVNGVEKIGSGEDHVTLKPSGTEYKIEYAFKKNYVELTSNALGGESLVRISPNGLNGIVSIGDSAFMDCSNLEEITIPMSVSHIGERAFMSCSSLTSIDIPNSVTSIGEGAFGGCESLVSIKLSNALTSIARYTFLYCESLQEITIPQSVISIGEYAFVSSLMPSSIEIPSSVISLGPWAFFNCDGLHEIEIPESVIKIGREAFADSEIRSVKYRGKTYTSKPTLIDELESNGVIVGSDAFDRTELNNALEGYVDLGLPSGKFWAKCNLGAEKESDYGKYFQWGDTVGYEGDEAKAHSTWSTAPFNNGSSSYDSAYFTANSGTWLTEKAELKPQYDAVYQATNGQAHMPTPAEFKELYDNTTVTWETNFNGSGVNGRKFTSKTDETKYIFFPAAGYSLGDKWFDVGSYGVVWSSSLHSSNTSHAFNLGFYSGGVYPADRNTRYNGYSVRGVC